MRNIIGAILTGVLIGISIPVAASTVADAQNLICVMLMTFDCGTEGACNKGDARSIDVPLFYRVKFAEKMVAGVMSDGGTRTSEIAQFDQDESGIYLHGNQNGRSWSATVTKESGALTATVSSDNEAFVIFGRCTPDD